ncbi:hypothetical protein ACLB0R_13405 [Sphingomonas sp. GlSt437]|uniref:hypothetical protein n=1 Tax=Sphingomonas sp. GlSt437 TaxID=3389970 RepID=UPI003A8361D0
MTSVEQARDDLAQRLVVLGARVVQAPRDAIAAEVETIRRTAQAHGIYPAVAVAHALEMALGRGERGPLIEGWIAVLRDAVLSDRADDAARDACLAAGAVRLAG